MASGAKITVKQQFWKDFSNYNLLEEVKQMKCPILFVHGSADDKVPPSEMRECFAAAGVSKEKIIIEGANHNMNPKREEMYSIVTQWLAKQLG